MKVLLCGGEMGRPGGAAANARILLVEDEPTLGASAVAMLSRHGFDVRLAATGGEAIEAYRRYHPDLTLLDYDLPDMDGLDVLDQLKEGSEAPPSPVLFLTGARGAAADQVLGLEHGASDYILKGTDTHVLLARINAILRDRLRAGTPTLRRGRLLIDLANGRLEVSGRLVDLDRKPLQALYYLASREGQTVGRDELLHAVWGTDFGGFARCVDQAIYVVRKTIGRDWVATVHGYGYRFQTLAD